MAKRAWDHLTSILVLRCPYLLLNLSATGDDHGLSERFDHARRQMLCGGAPSHQRRSTAWKVKHKIAECEDGSQRIPKPVVAAWAVNGETPQHARVSVVRG